MNLPKHIHIIGISGVATSALAIALHKRGVKVTGSDKGIFPPVSTELQKNKISFYVGWHPEKMLENGAPDLIMVGGSGTSPNNLEAIYAKEHNIPLKSYAQVIGDYFAKDQSIVCVGTWGKTSSTALLSYILDQAGFDPSFMFGAISLAHESSARLSDSDISVLEGDEYQAAIWDKQAKFFYYKPTHLLLSAVSWDHADMYPTEAEYFSAFKKLLAEMSATGFIVACADNEGVSKVIDSYSGKKIFYGRKGNKNAAYTYSNVSQSAKGLKLTINYNGQNFQVSSPMLGLYQSENITGCFALAHELGIESKKIIESIASFEGLKRRMEKRLDGETSSRGITIVDDIAHSPEKAVSVLNTLKSIYDGKVIAVFEPNIGGRQRESVAKYDNAFKDADIVIIPRLSAIKIGAEDSSKPLEGEELAAVIAKTHANAKYFDDDSKLLEFLASQSKKGDVIAFLGSHGFRGMIEATVHKVESL